MRTAMLMAWMLSGCAAVYDSVYNYEEGWRDAVVESISPDATQLAQASVDCRRIVPQGRYVYVRYESALRPRHAVVAVPENVEIQVSQRVYINIRDCSQVIVPEAPPSRDG
ncbi:hypothetical protein GTP58_29070 [Duganella sp. CY15W]|uniref:hypothetical protein n=1 Tax=Duganella sp. CY15W TaxID=2692172 RepID=UPI00136C812A|nr:hypothetical protein [Duganella sp. CY15W]MYM32391.1 hypothetical protein [Duganella sp. CY15W]